MMFLQMQMFGAEWDDSAQLPVLDVCDRSMGQKDHVEAEDGRILHLGLDLEYLHVAGADRQVSIKKCLGACHLSPSSLLNDWSLRHTFHSIATIKL